MAALDLQEQEQIDALKAWWNENSTQILAIVLLVAVSMGGWRGWQYYQGKQTIEAAALFSEFTRQLETNDAKRVNDAATALTDKYASTAFASRAALLAAQVNEFNKDTAKAKTQLQWVIDHASEPDLKVVARLRLASLLLDEKKYTEAISLLSAEHPASYDGLYADLKGDALSAQGKTEEARAAYQLAYDKIDSKSMYRSLIQMKMDALAPAK